MSALLNGPPAELTFYCWPHNTVHTFPVGDVEKIVYALGPVGGDQYASGFDDGGTPGMDPVRLPDDPQECWREVLRWADDSEMYAEHVEQGIECRSASDGEVVDAEINYEEWYTRAAEQRAAALAIHRPCHTAETEPYGCQHGHQGFDEDTGSISGVPDQPAECMACTYDDRTYVWPCPTAQALGVTP